MRFLPIFFSFFTLIACQPAGNEKYNAAFVSYIQEVHGISASQTGIYLVFNASCTNCIGHDKLRALSRLDVPGTLPFRVILIGGSPLRDKELSRVAMSFPTYTDSEQQSAQYELNLSKALLIHLKNGKVIHRQSFASFEPQAIASYLESLQTPPSYVTCQTSPRKRLFIIMPNILAIEIPGYAPESLDLESNHGKIDPIGKKHLVYINRGRAFELSIYGTKNGKRRLLSSEFFKVNTLLHPSFQIGKYKTPGKHKTLKISKKELSNADSLLVACPNFEYRYGAVQSYKMEIFRKGRATTFLGENAILTRQQKEKFARLSPGDSIKISQSFYYYPTLDSDLFGRTRKKTAHSAIDQTYYVE